MVELPGKDRNPQEAWTAGQVRNPGRAGAPGSAPGDELFLSPGEASGLLGSLDAQDRQVLGNPAGQEPDGEGVFIAPEELELEVGGMTAYTEPRQSTMPEHPQLERSWKNGDLAQSELLARIAGELKSIKSDIGNLKETYDDIMSRTHGSAAASGQPGTGASEDSKVSGQAGHDAEGNSPLSGQMVSDLKRLLSYLDKLLESLPEDRIDEFARSEYFELYRKVFERFDLV
jgi:hypothetical protein